MQGLIPTDKEDLKVLTLGLQWDNGSEYRTHIVALSTDMGLGKPDAKNKYRFDPQTRTYLTKGDQIKNNKKQQGRHTLNTPSLPKNILLL